MYDRNGMHAYKGFKAFFQHGSIYIVAVGIGAVEKDQWLALLRESFHHVVEGADVGKKADAHILQVKDKYIEIFQLLCIGLLVGSI